LLSGWSLIGAYIRPRGKRSNATVWLAGGLAIGSALSLVYLIWMYLCCGWP
jgi:hypothetical protein